MTKFKYTDLEKALIELDEIDKPGKNETPGNHAKYFLSEGWPQPLDEYLRENGFLFDIDSEFLEIDLKKLKQIKKVLQEIVAAYRSLDRDEKPENHFFAYPIFGQWGLLHFRGVGQHPHFSDDGVEYASGYPLKIINAIEHINKKNRKKAA